MGRRSVQCLVKGPTCWVLPYIHADLRTEKEFGIPGVGVKSVDTGWNIIKRRQNSCPYLTFSHEIVGSKAD
jgi:hypothetical protein